MADLKTQDMTVSEFSDYSLVKAGADKVGAVPFIGEPAVSTASVICTLIDMPAREISYFANGTSHPHASCQALKDTLGELRSPAFPKAPNTSSKTTSR